MFTDDFVIRVRGKFGSTVLDGMNYINQEMERWCQDKGLTINARKTEVIAFTKSRTRNKINNPVLCGEELKISNEVKHLGLRRKIALNAHLNYIH